MGEVWVKYDKIFENVWTFYCDFWGHCELHYVKEGRKRGPSGFGAVSGKIVSVEKWPIRDKNRSKMGVEKWSRNDPEMAYSRGGGRWSGEVKNRKFSIFLKSSKSAPNG